MITFWHRLSASGPDISQLGQESEQSSGCRAPTRSPRPGRFVRTILRKTMDRLREAGDSLREFFDARPLQLIEHHIY